MGAPDIGPGDFVECIDVSRGFGAIGLGRECSDYLTLGAIYQVARIAPSAHPLAVGRMSVWLKEFEGDRFYVGNNPKRFRPIYRPRADLIQHLLEPVEPVQPVTEDA